MKTLKEFAAWIAEETDALQPFSIEHLKTIALDEPIRISKLNDINFYVRGTLGRPIASGSFRRTWIIDDKRVLKVVIDVVSIGQNEQEKLNAECVGSKYSVQVIEHHPLFYWLIEERVTPLSEMDFVNHFNQRLSTDFGKRMDLEQYGTKSTSFAITDIINDFVTGQRRRQYKIIYPLFERSEWFKGLIESLKGCEVSSNDFHYENWGIRPSTGELVILDLGF
jgi:hypothetical protein